MKKSRLWILTAILTLCGTMSVQAQIKLPAGMRMEVAEAESGKTEATIFTYKDTDSDDSFAYYLGLGRVVKILGAIRDDITDASFDAIKETCIYLGDTSEEAFAALDKIMNLYDEDLKTTVELQSRAVTGSGRLDELTTTICVVTKKPIGGGKRLEFFFKSGDHISHTAHSFLLKSTLKELRAEFKIDKKLHPKQHR